MLIHDFFVMEVHKMIQDTIRRKINYYKEIILQNDPVNTCQHPQINCPNYIQSRKRGNQLFKEERKGENWEA